MVTIIRYANEGFQNYVQENGITGCYVFVRKAKGQALRYDKTLYPDKQNLARNKDEKHTRKVPDDTLVYARELPKLYLSEDGLSVRMDCDYDAFEKRPFIQQRVKDIADWQLKYEKLVKTVQENADEIRKQGEKAVSFTMLDYEFIAYEAIYTV